MIEIKYNIRKFIDERDGRVMIRVRWNRKKSEVTFCSGVYAQVDKWDYDQQKAKRNTTHEIRNMVFSATDINSCLSEFTEVIGACFSRCALKNTVPIPTELKNMVNLELGRNDDKTTIVETKKKNTLKQLYDEFIKYEGRVRNWDSKCKEKYNQAYTHYTSANPHITPDKIDLDSMYELRDWYVDNGYKNRTINKQVTMLKCFFTWIDKQDGYTIPKDVFAFRTNLKVIKRTVTFLHFDELMRFAHFKFENDDYGRLERARDLWCFMAFTSLRYSDLQALHVANIIDDCKIELVTQKTSDRISIPLTEYALELVRKYKSHPTGNDHLFDVPSNQKLNDAVKDAAKAAGLDRLIIDDYFLGSTRKQEIHKFYEIISCHDARRTFVSCSLAMGISPQVVMKCTGHSDYKTMVPYIETATETQTMEMEKWNKNQFKTRFWELIEKIPEGYELKILETLETTLKEMRILANIV